MVTSSWGQYVLLILNSKVLRNFLKTGIARAKGCILEKEAYCCKGGTNISNTIYFAKVISIYVPTGSYGLRLGEIVAIT